MECAAMKRSSLIPLLAMTMVAGPLAAADNQSASADKAAFNTSCRTCHSTKEGDNRLGPSLSSIIGAKAGTRQGYPNYSAAMKGSGITWDEQTLDKFIANPDSVVPNNNMKPFGGVPDANVRKKIIDALKSGAGEG
jgi:cytochrome c